MKRIIRDRLLTKEEAQKYQAMREDPELYNIAKKLTLSMGLPWTDPRTLETFHPEQKPKTKRKKKNAKTNISKTR
jgi:hypothetical protein